MITFIETSMVAAKSLPEVKDIMSDNNGIREEKEDPDFGINFFVLTM